MNEELLAGRQMVQKVSFMLQQSYVFVSTVINKRTCNIIKGGGKCGLRVR